MLRRLVLSVLVLSIAAFFYDVQAAPTAIATKEPAVIDTLNEVAEVDQTGGRVKRQGGGCGCCGCGGGCGCCGCGGGGGGGCGCCCCRPKCCCCCKRCCTCCRTCCCTRCCTCCKPCCCGCGGGCGCCGCGGGRKRRSLQNLRIKLADKNEKEANQTTSHEEIEKTTEAENVEGSGSSHEATEQPKLVKRNVQTAIGSIVDVPEWPNSYGYY